ncbi:MAG: ABC transporter ATP-binding protein, partial [Terriglobales bacterium]
MAYHGGMADPGAIVIAEAASKRYGGSVAATWALRGVCLAVGAGEFVAVTGRSGCGKTTLLNLLGAMDLPSSGRIVLRGRETNGLDDDGLTALRRTSVGFVFQAFHLLPTLSVRENIAMPLALAGLRADRRLAALAARLELAEKLDAFPHQLSGGEMQRVALARALIREPVLLLADEPTGNLDNQSAG